MKRYVQLKTANRGSYNSPPRTHDWSAAIRPNINPIAAAIATILCPLLVIACGPQASTDAGGVAGMLARLKPLIANCDGPINVYAGDDASASGRGDLTLTENRSQALHDLADQAAACGGYMKVVSFSSNAAETFPLGEAEFPTSSSTETARLIQANNAESQLLGEVDDNLPEALRELNANGTDVLAQLTLAQQFEAQRQDGSLYIAILSDGINTVKPVVMNTPSFSVQAARAAANQVFVPELADASVRIIGIGQSTGVKRPSTARINALTTFYELVCQRTGADCLVATEYTKRGSN